jgi:hypothetical protein
MQLTRDHPIAFHLARLRFGWLGGRLCREPARGQHKDGGGDKLSKGDVLAQPNLD